VKVKQELQERGQQTEVETGRNDEIDENQSVEEVE
jgi:hypothetical protein